MAGEPLTPLDATFLELEQADPSAHMHIGALMVFDPRPRASAPTLKELRAHVTRRLDALPRFRRRLSRRSVGGLHWLRWEVDEQVDLDVHVTRAVLPGPEGEAELLDWGAEFYAHRLDRSRPLWRMVLLEGLEGGRWGLATKTDHALVDGIGSLDVGYAMLDRSRDATWQVPARPHAVQGSRTGGWSQALGLPTRAAREALSLVLHPRQADSGGCWSAAARHGRRACARWCP